MQLCMYPLNCKKTAALYTNCLKKRNSYQTTNKPINTMKKLILIAAIIFGSNLAHAQRQLDTSDFFEGYLAQVIKDAPRPKVFIGSGKFDHSASIGRLKDIFNDSGEAFREIFGQMSEEFPGVTYSKDVSVPYIKLDDYYRENIKGHVYDSTRYTGSDPNQPDYIQENGKSILVERETIHCYDSTKTRVRFIQITRYNGEIVSVLDNGAELALKKNEETKG